MSIPITNKHNPFTRKANSNRQLHGRLIKKPRIWDPDDSSLKPIIPKSKQKAKKHKPLEKRDKLISAGAYPSTNKWPHIIQCHSPTGSNPRRETFWKPVGGV